MTIPTTTKTTTPKESGSAQPLSYRRCDRCGTWFALGRVNSTGRVCWHCKSPAEKEQARQMRGAS